MNDSIRDRIENALAAMPEADFVSGTQDLLKVLGYESTKRIPLSGDVDAFLAALPSPTPNTQSAAAFRTNTESAHIIFQLTDEEIAVEGSGQQSLFTIDDFDSGNSKSFLFVAVELTGENYPRGEYAQFTREINKHFPMPTVILFKTANDLLTLAFVHRRQNKRNPERDVLGSVALVRHIDPHTLHHAHLDILGDLALEERLRWMEINGQPINFDGLLAAWLDALDTEELNRRFYRDLFAWFERTIREATFPNNQQRTLPPEEHVIRLITRLLFVWFIKEKGLVAEELFVENQVCRLLKNYDRDTGDSYYRAVLQNLFFATLNTEISKRDFSKVSNTTHRDFSRYRYKKEINAPNALLDLFAQTPFINGGLFDCLDSEAATGDGGYRIDCFSDNPSHRNLLSIPNCLFFDDKGLISLFNRYKFTVEENTPIEQEVALDPELLGKVFENLLAAYNPETRKTARKQTGSYYTPRPVVDYMVDEALVETLAEKVPSNDGDAEFWRDRLRYLLDYNDASELFDTDETEGLVRVIAGIKILDPAVGSGAFPMGVLHKLTLALRRLDPENKQWEKLQKEMAVQRAAVAFDNRNQPEREAELKEISDTFERYRDSDFGRKLYLIQNSIFGVDIQPIACQIAKLRFFISLAIEQESNGKKDDNFGIQPLPNLETRFVAANTLLRLEDPGQLDLFRRQIEALKTKLSENRERHFHATTRRKKLACRKEDKELREALAMELQSAGLPRDDASKIAHWDPYDQNDKADWFDVEYMFGATDRFDMVIGNPPYGAKIDQGDLKQIKTQIKDTKNSNSAALFVDYAKNRFIKTDGVVAFIVPKSLLYSEIWQDLAFALSKKIVTLVDVEKAFEKVKLEQVVFVYSALCNDKYYVGCKFLNSVFTRTTRINKNIPKKFQAHICDVSNEEIKLGLRIASIGTYLKDISRTTRGLPIQKLLTENGDIQVVGGKEITRYGITGVKGFIDKKKLGSTNRKLQNLFQPKVLSQNIIAHVQNPLPHIKITSTVDKTGDVLSVDTVMNTVVTDPNVSPVFISALFNSTLINWYAYKFIFCSAIRTMHFDSYYVGKIPVPVITREQHSLIRLVDYIIYLKQHPFTDGKNLSHARDYLMVKYFEQIIDGLIYELYLTDELHSAGKYFSKPLLDEKLPSIEDIADDEMPALRGIFERLFDKKHPVRRNLFFLDSLEIIRIIEGKVDVSGQRVVIGRPTITEPIAMPAEDPHENYKD